MSEHTLYPGLVWVKDPVNPNTGEATGAAPPMRHHDDCPHWYRDERGNLIGDPPYRASEDQMRALPYCTTCAGATTRSGAGRSPIRESTDQCPVCHQTRSLSGACECD